MIRDPGRRTILTAVLPARGKNCWMLWTLLTDWMKILTGIKVQEQLSKTSLLLLEHFWSLIVCLSVFESKAVSSSKKIESSEHAVHLQSENISKHAVLFLGTVLNEFKPFDKLQTLLRTRYTQKKEHASRHLKVRYFMMGSARYKAHTFQKTPHSSFLQ